MRKIVMALIVAAIITCMSIAVAEAVSSPVAPTVVLDSIAPVEDVVLSDSFTIIIVEEELYPESVTLLYEDIKQMVAEGKNIVEVYTDEEQQTMSGILPEEYDLNKLQVSEFVLLSATGYSEELGDIMVLLNVPGEYDEGDTVIAMIGLLAASDTETEAEVMWTPLTVNIVEGKLQMVFDPITLTHMEAHGTVLMILREEVR